MQGISSADICNVAETSGDLRAVKTAPATTTTGRLHNTAASTVGRADSRPRRLERLEETLQICRQMWRDNDGPHEGRHYQLAETLCSPRPCARRRP